MVVDSINDVDDELEFVADKSAGLAIDGTVVGVFVIADDEDKEPFKALKGVADEFESSFCC